MVSTFPMQQSTVTVPPKVLEAMSEDEITDLLDILGLASMKANLAGFDGSALANATFEELSEVGLASAHIKRLQKEILPFRSPYSPWLQSEEAKQSLPDPESPSWAQRSPPSLAAKTILHPAFISPGKGSTQAPTQFWSTEDMNQCIQDALQEKTREMASHLEAHTMHVQALRRERDGLEANLAKTGAELEATRSSEEKLLAESRDLANRLERTKGYTIKMVLAKLMHARAWRALRTWAAHIDKVRGLRLASQVARLEGAVSMQQINSKTQIELMQKDHDTILRIQQREMSARHEHEIRLLRTSIESKGTHLSSVLAETRAELDSARRELAQRNQEHSASLESQANLHAQALRGLQADLSQVQVQLSEEADRLEGDVQCAKVQVQGLAAHMKAASPAMIVRSLYWGTVRRAWVKWNRVTRAMVRKEAQGLARNLQGEARKHTKTTQALADSAAELVYTRTQLQQELEGTKISLTQELDKAKQELSLAQSTIQTQDQARRKDIDHWQKELEVTRGSRESDLQALEEALVRSKSTVAALTERLAEREQAHREELDKVKREYLRHIANQRKEIESHYRTQHKQTSMPKSEYRSSPISPPHRR